jgi:signal peptidase II
MSWKFPRRLPWLLLISIAIFAADRVAKLWVIAHIPYAGAIPVIPHVLRISHWTNDGAAFSMFADSASPGLVNHILIGVNLLVAAGVLIAQVRLGGRIRMVTVSLALILGGALGNVYERIVSKAVTDFIEVHIFSYHYPDFNIADSAIVTGACLLILDSLRAKDRDQGSGVRDQAS